MAFSLASFLRSHDVMHTSESDSAVSCSTQSLTLRCPTPNRVWLCGVLLNTESDTAVSCSIQSLTLRCPAQHRVVHCDALLNIFRLFSLQNFTFFLNFITFTRVSYLLIEFRTFHSFIQVVCLFRVAYLFNPLLPNTPSPYLPSSRTLPTHTYHFNSPHILITHTHHTPPPQTLT